MHGWGARLPTAALPDRLIACRGGLLSVEKCYMGNIGAPCPKKMNFWPAGDNLWRSLIVFTVEATPQL
jgi:hypothetical protein